MARSNGLSDTDRRILELLQSDGRASYAEIGAAIGMSAPSAHEHVKRLEARGAITGYRADIDARVAGIGVLAFTLIRQAPGTTATDLTAAFAEIPELEECHHIAGEADYLLKVRAVDTLDLERVMRRIQGVPHVYTTETDVVFSTAFERRPLDLGPSATPADQTDERSGA
jgi:Lrp/AsnC family transcriptional regulator, leucine-responsive regulatory protein